MRTAHVVFALATVAVLAGCASDAEPESDDVTVTTDNNSPSPTRDSGETTVQNGNGSGSTAPSTSPNQPGGSIPSDAAAITTIKNPRYGDPLAVFQMPSGNIGCWISDTELNCRIDSYSQDSPMGGTDYGANNQVNITGSSATIGMAGDVPAYMYRAFGADDTVRAQTVEYGTSVYHGPFVCTSEEDGLTCWNSDTGAGAKMNRAGTEFF